MNGSPIPPVVKELMLAVDPARAFRTFTEQVRSWWPVATHSVGGVDGIGLRLDEDGFVALLNNGPPQPESAQQGGDDPGQMPEVKLDVVTQDNLEEYVRDDMADAMFVPTMLPDEILSELFG